MTTDAAASTVLQGRQDGVLTLTLNRPERLNAFTSGLLDELAARLAAAANDDDVRVVVLTGAGRAFCSGQDLKVAAAEAGEKGGLDVRQELRDHYHPVIVALRSLPKPVIAAINGPASGAGFSLALAADLRIAAESARFDMGFVHIGLIPDAGSTYFLPRLVGPARAAELMMLGDPVDARQALDIGLVSRAVPDAELLTTVHEMAARLASGPRSIAFIKEALTLSAANDLEGQLGVEERLQEAAARTHDFVEGLTAFLEKRAPSFSGR